MKRKKENIELESNKKLKSEQEPPSDMAIEEARHLGKMEGIALGIMVLFRQDQILKPSEQIVNTEILGVGGLDLDALETFLNIEELNDKEKVSILIKYIQDDTIPLYANIVYYNCVIWDEWSDMEYYSISKEQKEKLIKSKASSVEEVIAILSQDDIENGDPTTELTGDSAN